MWTNQFRHELDRHIPSLEQLFPEMNQIPNMWSKECRTYHTTTKKKILHQSIQWKTVIKINISGLEKLVLPKKINEHRDQWSVTVIKEGEEITLFPDQWQEMQLILPVRSSKT